MRYETRIDGMGSLPSGDYKNIKIDGVGTINGPITFQRLCVDGTCKSKGPLQGEELIVHGNLRSLANVKVKSLRVDGIFRSDAIKLYCDKIEVNGILKNDEEVSADVIKVYGILQTPALHGDYIELNFKKFHGFSFSLHHILGLQKLFQKVDHIECTNLKASNLRCAYIAAQEITLREFSEIDYIECDGTIYVDRSCKIKEIKGNYKIIEI